MVAFSVLREGFLSIFEVCFLYISFRLLAILAINVVDWAGKMEQWLKLLLTSLRTYINTRWTWRPTCNPRTEGMERGESLEQVSYLD